MKFLKESRKHNVSLSNVKPEFLKIFRLYSLNEADYVADLMNFDSDETEASTPVLVTEIKLLRTKTKNSYLRS